MSRFYDVLETRLPAEREQELLTALQVQLSHVKAHTSWGPLLQDVTPQNILTPDDMSDIPVLRKSDLKALQDKQKPFGGLVAAKWPQIKYVFSSPGPIYEPESYRADYFRSARALYAAGFRAGDIVHNCFSYHLTPAGRIPPPAGLPPTRALNRSGYWVLEWLPQIVIFLIDDTGLPSLAASCDTARLWSRRVIAVKRRGSRPAAFCWPATPGLRKMATG